MRTAEEVLDGLVDGGAVIQVMGRGSWLVAWAKLVDNNLAWCTTYPANQADTHLVEANDYHIFHDRDIGLFKDGAMVAYVCPVAEADPGGVPAWTAEWADWVAFRNDFPDWRAQLAKLMADSLGLA